MGSQSRAGSQVKMKTQILGLIFVGLLPFFVSGTQAKDGHIMRFGRSAQDQNDKRAGGQLMRFGRSVMNQNDMFMRALRQAGSSDMFMRALRSPDMLMRALRSSDMFMRALRSNDALTRGQRSSDMFMRALREDPSLMNNAIENDEN